MRNTPIEPIKFWVQKVLPQVYDDSLSYMELLGKVVYKINEIIGVTTEQWEAIADLERKTEDMVTEEMLAETVETLTADITAIINEVDERKVEKYISALDTTFVYTSKEGVQGHLPATTFPTGGTIVMRDSEGNVTVGNEPVNNGDATPKSYVDNAVAYIANQISTLGSLIEGELAGKVDKITAPIGIKAYTVEGTTQGGTLVTNSPTGDTIPYRDYEGNIGVGVEPVNAQDATSKNYVDNVADTKVTKITNATGNICYGADQNGERSFRLTSASTGNTVALRSGSGTVQVEDPTNTKDAANKGYVDAAIAGAPAFNFAVTNVFNGTASVDTTTPFCYVPADTKAIIVEFQNSTSDSPRKQTAVFMLGTNTGTATYDYRFSGVCTSYITDFASFANHYLTGVVRVGSGSSRSVWFADRNTLAQGYGACTISNVWSVNW